MVVVWHPVMDAVEVSPGRWVLSDGPESSITGPYAIVQQFDIDGQTWFRGVTWFRPRELFGWFKDFRTACAYARADHTLRSHELHMLPANVTYTGTRPPHGRPEGFVWHE